MRTEDDQAAKRNKTREREGTAENDEGYDSIHMYANVLIKPSMYE